LQMMIGKPSVLSESNHFWLLVKRTLYSYQKLPTKTAARHIGSNYLEMAEDFKHTPKYATVYELRKETIVFADAEERLTDWN
jgi:hypothetical protein